MTDLDATLEERPPETERDDRTGSSSDATGPGQLTGPAPDQRSRPRGRRTDQGVRREATDADDHPTREAVVSAVVDHEPGVLAEVAGLFSRRQFNIESLTVGPTADPDHARITIVVEESDPGIAQVKKQLGGLIPVREVRELADRAVCRELALIEVSADRPEQVRAALQAYDGDVVDAGTDTITVEVTGPTDRIDDAIVTFAAFGLRELTRTGTTAVARSGTPTTEWPHHDRTGETTDPAEPRR